MEGDNEFNKLVEALRTFTSDLKILPELQAAFHGSLKIFSPDALNRTHGLAVHLILDNDQRDPTLAFEVIGAQAILLTDLESSGNVLGVVSDLNGSQRLVDFRDIPCPPDRVNCVTFLLAQTVSGHRVVSTIVNASAPGGDGEDWEERLKGRIGLSAVKDASGTSPRQRARAAGGVSLVSFFSLES